MRIKLAILLMIIICIDQYTKYYIQTLIAGISFIKINQFINLHSVWNTGMSFGILNGSPYSNWLFIAISTIVAITLIIIIFRSNHNGNKIALIMILSGAIGNLTDRIRFGAVYDFIDLHIYELHWPTFNFADSIIMLGVTVLLINELR